MKRMYRVTEHNNKWNVTVYRQRGNQASISKIYVIRKPNDPDYVRSPSYKITVSPSTAHRSAVKLPAKFDNLIRAWVQLRGET